jgi:hypothetical protein
VGEKRQADFMRSLPRPHVVAHFLATLLAVAAATGCGEKLITGSVKGKVTFNGQPVQEGSVTFLNPTEGGTAGADIQSDGTFDCGDVVAGKYIVTISPPVTIVDTDPGKSPPAPVEKNMRNIPPKYRQQNSTPLTAEVKAGEDHDFTFEMKP